MNVCLCQLEGSRQRGMTLTEYLPATAGPSSMQAEERGTKDHIAPCTVDMQSRHRRVMALQSACIALDTHPHWYLDGFVCTSVVAYLD